MRRQGRKAEPLRQKHFGKHTVLSREVAPVYNGTARDRIFFPFNEGSILIQVFR